MADHHDREDHEPGEVGVGADPLEAPAHGVWFCPIPAIASEDAMPKPATITVVASA